MAVYINRFLIHFNRFQPSSLIFTPSFSPHSPPPMADRRSTPSNFNFPTGFSSTFPFDHPTNNKPSSSSNHLSKNTMDSSRILGPETTATDDDNQDHKRRCFEKLLVRTEQKKNHHQHHLVEDVVKCALQVEVIDDTALIEATAAVSGFKKNRCFKNQVGNGYRSFKAPIVGSKKVNKQENDGRKKRNKGSKKVLRSCSTNCVNENKVNNGQTFEGQSGGATEKKKKKVPEGKGPKMLRKMYGGGKVKAVYQRKDTKVVNATDLEEPQIVENHNVPIKNVSNGVFPEPEMLISKASNGIEFEKESTLEFIETETVSEKDDGLTPKADIHTEKIEEDDQEVSENPTVGSKKMAYSMEEIKALRIVDEKDDGLNPKTDVHPEKIEENDQEVRENPTVGLKKMAYSREEIEALRFVDEKDDGSTLKTNIHTEKIEEKEQEVRENPTVGLKKLAYSREEIEALRFVGEGEQIEKWGEVFSRLSPSVAKEYTSLLVETDNRQSQRYTRVANCGSSRNAILSMPPFLPVCSSSNDRKFAPYGRGFRVNFH